LLKNGKNDKKKKKLLCFPVFSSHNFGFYIEDTQICRYQTHAAMNDDIKYLHLCGRLLTGKSVDGFFSDPVNADNVLYKSFGMSSEDIQENLRGNVDNATFFY